VRARLEEERQDLGVAVLGGLDERRVAAARASVRRDPRLDEELDGLLVAVVDGLQEALLGGLVVHALELLLRLLGIGRVRCGRQDENGAHRREESLHLEPPFFAAGFFAAGGFARSFFISGERAEATRTAFSFAKFAPPSRRAFATSTLSIATAR